MKSIPTLITSADEDDMFGPARSYSTSNYYTTRHQRPSMISAKYRQKEERRKVLKISVNKLRKIEDPESSLCRSVLINNTMKRLQREAKEEKILQMKKTQPIVSDFAIDTDDILPQELNNVVNNNFGNSRKRNADDLLEECDVQDVLSQFYMPPTPRMLTSIDEDEEIIQEPKKPRLNEDRSLNNVPEKTLLPSQVPVTTASSFSCGHSSIFNDLQSTVFHSLVASLET